VTAGRRASSWGSDRRFVMSFRERGVTMARGTTTSLNEAATATGVWQPGAVLENLRSACPFVHYGPLSEAHERGTAVETMWSIYRQTTASHVDHDLVEAAYAQPQLRALFPSTATGRRTSAAAPDSPTPTTFR